MKFIETSKQLTHRSTVACAASCKKLLASIAKARNALVAEFRKQIAPYDHLLDLALNEAEALAWQTSYPHLVFPTLAAEKAHAVVEWKQTAHVPGPMKERYQFWLDPYRQFLGARAHQWSVMRPGKRAQ